MPQPSLNESDVESLASPLGVEPLSYRSLASLAQAASVDELLRLVLASCEQLCGAHSLHVAWLAGEGHEPIGTLGSAEAYAPTAAELTRLGQGELLQSGERPDGRVRYLVPLRLHGVTRGWMRLESRATPDGHEHDDTPSELLELLAAQVTLALLALRSERQARQSESINQIGRLITSTLDVAQIPQLIMDQAQHLLDAEEGSLLLADESGDLVFTYTTGPSGTRLLGERIPRGSGIAGYVCDTGRSEIVDDVTRDTRFYGQADAHSGIVTRSLLAVPLRGRTGILGVIEVINKRSGQPFDRADCQLLEAVADQAVIALENARRYSAVDQALARRAQELAVSNNHLREILRVGNMLRVERRLDELLGQIAAGASRCTGFAAARIYLVQRHGVRRPVLVAISTAGLAATASASAALEDVEALLLPQQRLSNATYLLPASNVLGLCDPSEAGQGNLVLCPLRSGDGQMLGVLTVCTPVESGRPTIEQIQSLEIFANQGATAIENASLYDRLQHNLQSLTALNALSMALNSTLRSVPQILSLTASGAVASTGALGASVLIADGLTGALEHAYSSGPEHDADLDALALRVLVSQRPETVDLADGALPETIRRVGGQSAIAVPLRATRAMLGAMIVYFAEERPGLSAQETLVLFAGQAAVAIESLQLLDALHQGRDRLASIMASTREGMLMLDADGRVVVTNAALRRLCDVDEVAEGQALRGFLASWRAKTGYTAGEWNALEESIAAVGGGRAEFAGGQLNQEHPRRQALEWASLPVRGEGRSGNGVLLVLRDITATKESEKLREDLTNMIVHDLRSPISSVLAAIDLLARGIPGDLTPRQQSVLAIAAKASENLLSMVSMLLDISRLEGGSMPLNRTVTALPPLALRASQSLIALAEEREVHVELAIPPALPPLLGDGELIARVCQNLLDNAIKFSNVGSEVTLTARMVVEDELPMVLVAVQDQGVGIRPEDQAKIFEKFGQVGERRGGSGLGLTFCLLVIEAHGGRIWVESTPNCGSTFCFTLPIAPR
jgi:signal transduction histidine kinase